MENDRGTFKKFFPFHISICSNWYSFAAKRLIDILISALGLFALTPIFIFLSILIKRDSHGPVFFRGRRVGCNGRIFHILKFRTMRDDAASYAGPGITAKDDPRITPLGKWLRDTKINELPQLWNVLIGEMSLVGPRPEAPEFVAAWPESARAEILFMRPGITSPASVAYHDEEGLLQSDNVMKHYLERIAPDKLRLDQLYVRHHTFLGDLDTLFWTFVILIPRMKDKKIPEGWLFGGPVSRFLRRYVSWTVYDFLIAFLCIGSLGGLWRLNGSFDLGIWRAGGLAAIMTFLFSFFNILLGLKNVSWARASSDDVLRLIISCGLVTIMAMVLQAVLSPQYSLPVSFMFAAGALVLIGFVAIRYRLRLITGFADRWIDLRHSGYGAGERVLMVGAGDGCRFAAWLLRQKEFRKLYTVIGIVDDAPAKQGMYYDGLKVLGTVADVPELIRMYDIDVLFNTISTISSMDNHRIMAICNATRLRLLTLSDVMSALHYSLTRDWSRYENDLSRSDSIKPNLRVDEMDIHK